jgi:hypothetical protein
LDEKNDRLIAEFRLKEQPSYRYDPQAGMLTYGGGDLPHVAVQVQVIGTTSVKEGDWMWGWGNPSWPAGLVSDVKRVREFGEEHGIEELTKARVIPEDMEGMGRGFAAIAVRVVDALGAFHLKRDDDPGEGCYLFVKSINWAPLEQRREKSGLLTRLLKGLRG